MLTKLLTQLREYDMVQPGDAVVCAVSGGADSVAMLFALYLLREKLEINLLAAHFNHRLRGEESDRDEAFVREFCLRYEIPLTVGSGDIVSGKKGLEAAAREARYAFFDTLPGKIATAHTADDNAETVLMHLVRGTGLKGLGGIAPVNRRILRPMLTITRQEVLAFLEEYHLPFVEDSSNDTDQFLRNRLRHRVMPILKEENPCLAENLSAMAMELRRDAEALEPAGTLPRVSQLRQMQPALRSRALVAFLRESGVPEPERRHIRLAESLVLSERPSAWAVFPGGVVIGREYDRLVCREKTDALKEVILQPGQTVELPELSLQVSYGPAEEICNTKEIFTVNTQGPVVLRPRQTGDTIRLNAGNRTLKKLFVDRKIPESMRNLIPVFADSQGILGVGGIGANVDRLAAELPAMQIRLKTIE